MTDLLAFTGLVTASFLAATLLPVQSEAVLAGLLLNTTYSVVLLIAVASAGNILGSCVNWYLGMFIERYKTQKWFPVKAAALERAQAQYKRYGRWTLLLSWVPFIGDPLTLVAGVMKEKFVIFLPIVAVAKIARYCVIAGLVL